MFDVLGTIAGVRIYSYAVIHLIAWIFFGVAMAKLLRQEKLRAIHGFSFFVLYGLSNFLGARVLYLIKTQTFDLAHLLSTESGFWGWLILFLPLTATYLVLTRLPTIKVLKALSLSLLPTFALQKLACFAAGCCWGRPTDLPWGIRFPKNDFVTAVGPLHPVQLYDVAAPLLALFIAKVYLLTPTREKYLFPFALAFYSVGRFFSEFFRGDLTKDQGALFHLTPSQILEGTTALASLSILIFLCAQGTISKTLQTSYRKQSPSSP
jgi:phosphatidylglycerol:prolipoprotein diacylglycerol transferase